MTARREKRPRVLEVPRDREAEKALAGMAGLSLTQFRRICRGTDLQCLACGKILHSPPSQTVRRAVPKSIHGAAEKDGGGLMMLSSGGRLKNGQLLWTPTLENIFPTFPINVIIFSMLDLRKNPFHLLGVLPEATATEIMDAREDAEADGVAPEQELQMAAGALSHPRKRLTCEISSLWGVPQKSASALLASVSGEGEFDIADENLPPLARANLAAYVCTLGLLSADDDRRQVVEGLIKARDDIVAAALQGEFNTARKKAGIPPVQEEHLRDAVVELTKAHLDAALNVVEKAAHPGKLMTGIVEEWRYVKTPGGFFVHDMAEGYGRWSVSILRPIGERIRESAKALRQNPDNSGALAAIEQGLAEWDEYSQPVQLKEESKGLDERESLDLYHDLRQLALHLANEKDKYSVSLKISNVLMQTFPELPTVRGQLSDDIKTLKKLTANESFMAKLKPLQDLVEEIKDDIINFASAVRSGGEMWWRFNRILSAVADNRNLASSERVWGMLRHVAIELHNHGHAQAAFSVMSAIVRCTGACAVTPSEIRKRLEEDLSALHLNQKRGELKQAIKNKHFAVAKKAALELAALTDDNEERNMARSIAIQIEDDLSRPVRIHSPPPRVHPPPPSHPTRDEGSETNWLSVIGTVAFLGWLAFSFFSDDSSSPSVSASKSSQSTPQQAASPRPGLYTVKRGDTLSKIALAHGLDYRDLARWNNISTSDILRVGRSMRLTPIPGANSPVAKQPRVKALPKPRPAFSASAVPIRTGLVHSPASPGLAPLMVRTQNGANYYVKVSRPSGGDVLSMYIRGGESFETHVPLGTYEIKYASGRVWYGTHHLFGPDTAYSKADTMFRFTSASDGYSGYEIQLYRVLNGNLSTTEIPAKDF